MTSQRLKCAVLLSVGACALSIGWHTSAALAQDAAAGVSQIDTIVVTAQRRAENQQDVPVSVSALTGEFIQKTDVRTLEDLTGAVPGFVATNSVNYSAAPLSIRGVGGVNGGANFFNDEPVAVYVDGVYIGRLSFSTADLIDIKSVQVLRGPQGTLFGRNATAGALLIESDAPTDGVEGFFRADYNSLDEYRLSTAVSGPIIEDKLSGRLAVGWSDRQGFGDNLFTGDEVGGSEDLTVRGRLTYTPTDRLTINLITEYMEREADPATIQRGDLLNQPSNPSTERADFRELVEDNKFNLNTANFIESETLTTSIAAEYAFDWATLNVIGAYRSFDQEGAQDSDGTELSLFANTGEFENEQYTAEVRLSSTGDGPFSWIGGLFYIHEDNEMNQFVIQNINGFFGLGVEPIFRTFQDLDSVAAFVDGTYEVTDKLSLSVGARYTYEEKDFSGTTTTTILNGGTVPPIPPAGAAGGLTFPAGTPFPIGSTGNASFADSEEFDDFSPRVVVDYQASDDMLLYASYSQGYKSGGFNSFGLAPAFDPEEIDAYEIGIKSDWLDGRLRVNSSAFYYDYTDLQVRVGVPTGGVDIQNAASAELKGAEFEVTALPIDGLTLTANAAYLDAEFTEGTLPAVPTDQQFFIGAPVALLPEDIDGNRLSRAPEWQLYLAGEYERPIEGLGVAALRVDWRYQSEVFFLEVNQDQETFSEDSWHEVGIRASLKTMDERLEFAVYGQNIGNERYVTQVTQLGSFPNAAVNEPRKWGGQVTVRF